MDLPRSYYEFAILAAEDPETITECECCREHFSPCNVHTRAGWEETQISGMCEDCFDGLFTSNEHGD